MSNLKGKITEFLGQWTNDRDTEAKGRAEKRAENTEPGPGDEQVEREKERVRRDHGDVNR